MAGIGKLNIRADDRRQRRQGGISIVFTESRDAFELADSPTQSQLIVHQPLLAAVRDRIRSR